jgi:hypothetical protein
MEGIGMGLSLLTIPLLAVLAPLQANPQPPSGMPLMSSVEPAPGRVGDVLVVQGAGLGPDSLAALYLTDGKTDVKLLIIEQTSTSIRAAFR